MSERVRLHPVEPVGTYGAYFASEKTHLDFISTGCVGLDAAIGGGWVLGRIGNIVGPKSVGKTLMAIEAAANFAIKYPNGKIYYRESEAAFDEEYARALGMPIDRVSFIEEDQDFFTIEDFYNDLNNRLDEVIKENIPALYILDSLDGLSDKEEQEREFDEGSYNMTKAKQMGKLFRKLIKKIDQANMSIIIISQERDKIGVTFGKKVTRSGGGRALDFYLTHTVWMSQLELVTKKKTYNGKLVTRAIGIKVKAKCEKNKVSAPFREFTFDIIFGMGVDNFTSGIDWLIEIGRYDALGFDSEKAVKLHYNSMNKAGDEIYWKEVEKVNAAVKKTWLEVEQDFLSTRQKHRIA